MSVHPVTQPGGPQRPDPTDLLIAIEEASQEPIQPEYVEGLILVPPQPDHELKHNAAAFELSSRLRSAGFALAGLGNGYRVGLGDGRTVALLIPDFYVLRREPTDLDEAYRAARKGWYPIDMLALAGEVTSGNHETDTGPKLRAYATAGVPCAFSCTARRAVPTSTRTPCPFRTHPPTATTGPSPPSN
ncbi:Uma2 family endonuclease [Streptomyces johnsoniae]|uniref:Uma2 family endonuclease n=1 Tax=Streptomyces johnsoniae TaxID=3075532 RepID=A0ABU2S3P8_9ACTN|nr:Uma2 family endonuclease [Streptomyces sp. DSM 41886]MDT0443592.1 Uma2 family endonuclease [Streptomyces sp. DSM 41886]